MSELPLKLPLIRSELMSILSLCSAELRSISISPMLLAEDESLSSTPERDMLPSRSVPFRPSAYASALKLADEPAYFFSPSAPKSAFAMSALSIRYPAGRPSSLSPRAPSFSALAVRVAVRAGSLLPKLMSKPSGE